MRIYYEWSNDPRSATYNELIKANFPQFLEEKSPEVVLVAGGDGALHHVTKKFQDFTGIFVGKAKGTLNFLMNSIDDDLQMLHSLVSGELQLSVIETATYLVTSTTSTLSFVAVNDIIFGDSVNAYHSFVINTKDGSFTNFTAKGTGLCISTPLGSTAYNFNNGGVILPLESNLLALSGIVCNKYINDVLEAQQITVSASGGNVTVDGVLMGSLSAANTIIITPNKPIKLGFVDKKAFMQRRIELGDRLRKGSI